MASRMAPAVVSAPAARGPVTESAVCSAGRAGGAGVAVVVVTVEDGAGRDEESVAGAADDAGTAAGAEGVSGALGTGAGGTAGAGAAGGADGAGGAVRDGFGVLEGFGVGVAGDWHRPNGSTTTGLQGSAAAGAATARAARARAVRAVPTMALLRVLILDILRSATSGPGDFDRFSARSTPERPLAVAGSRQLKVDGKRKLERCGPDGLIEQLVDRGLPIQFGWRRRFHRKTLCEPGPGHRA